MSSYQLLQLHRRKHHIVTRHCLVWEQLCPRVQYLLQRVANVVQSITRARYESVPVVLLCQVVKLQQGNRRHIVGNRNITGLSLIYYHLRICLTIFHVPREHLHFKTAL